MVEGIDYFWDEETQQFYTHNGVVGVLQIIG